MRKRRKKIKGETVSNQKQATQRKRRRHREKKKGRRTRFLDFAGPSSGSS